ncbi:extracellular solute-binding protein [Agarivorans aestuarii]|uniref:Extracellular solute-binding protein n=1 Tax=Agarivorans aestuarii TaxID=1563703 RepID=A0ABU7G075_9ALTE|nr:extracellular solute-binding protein [Agarivorans aestuarii]MEE1672662.1 extracellular solute-binding protein [Agarivorans aestuarii]
MRFVLLLLAIVWGSASAEQLSFLYYREQGKAIFQELLDEFSAQSQHQVTLYQITSESLKPSLIKSVLQGTAADVAFAPSDIIGITEQAKLSAVPREFIDSSTPSSLLLTATIDEQLHGIPILQGNHLMLFYNRRLVEQPASTWQELLDQKKHFDEQGIATIGWNYSEMYWFAGFYNTFGGRMTRGKLVTLDQPPMEDALNFYKSLTKRSLVSAECTYDCGYKDFIEGKVAYAINGEWAIADFEHHLGDELGIALIPNIGNRAFKPLSSSLVLVFPDNSLNSNKAAALKELSEYLQSEKVQQRLYQEARFLPVNADLLDQIKQQSNPNEAAMLAQLEQAVPMSAEAAQASAWLGLRKGFELFSKGVLDAAKAREYMQQFAERDYRQTQKQ